MLWEAEGSGPPQRFTPPRVRLSRMQFPLICSPDGSHFYDSFTHARLPSSWNIDFGAGKIFQPNTNINAH